MKNNKYLTEKYGRNIKVQHFQEEIRSIQTSAKQKEHDDVTQEVANSQLKKETVAGDGQ